MNRISSRLIAYIVAFLSVTGVAQARDVLVPGDEHTLAEALRIADAGDRILLQAGIYREWGLQLVTGVTIEGDVEDPSRVVIDGGFNDRVLRAEGASDTHVKGLTITGGYATGSTSYMSSGGGVFVSRSSVVFENVVFVDNRADASGGGMRVAHSTVSLVNCSFLGCTAIKGGGAIDLSYSSIAEFDGMLFHNNRAAWGGAVSARGDTSCLFRTTVFMANSTLLPHEIGGAFFADHAARVAFIECVMSGNGARKGGAALLSEAASTFLNCTIDNNTASEAGGAFMIREGELYLDHTIVSNNLGSAVTAEEGIIVWASATDVYGNTGGDWEGALRDLRDENDNIETNPLFCDPFDYRLTENSPCAELNSPVGLIGALPAGCDQVGIVVRGFEVDVEFHEVSLAWNMDNAEGVEFRLVCRSQDQPDQPTWIVDDITETQPGSFIASDSPNVGAFPVVYRLEARMARESWSFVSEVVATRALEIVSPLEVESIFPNPFNPQVTIRIKLADTMDIEAVIYDIRGYAVRTIHRGSLSGGEHALAWDSRDNNGQAMPAGTYLLRLHGGDKLQTHKLLLVK